MHRRVISLSVWNQSQKSSKTLSTRASKDSAQTPTPASAPPPVFCSEAQTCWSNTRWDEAPASVWECRPSCFFSLLLLSNPVHVKSPPAPQGGGWTHLWGDRYLLLLHIINFFPLSVFSLNPCDCCMFWSLKKGPRVNVDYILCTDYTFRLV